MPRYNNEGRSAKFIHTGRGGGGGHQGQGKTFNDFKFTSQQNRGIQKKHKHKQFQRLDDAGDVIMGGEPLASGSGHGGHRRNKRGWKNKMSHKSMKNSDFIFGPSWHKVTIVDGTSFDRDILLSSLLDLCRVPFTPIAYSVVQTNTVFYLEERTAAQAIAECSGNITLGDNQKVNFRIHPCQFPPTANFDIICETKVKGELERRYNGQIQSLSLSNFLMSPELIREHFLPLTRSSVAMKLLSLVEPLLITLVGLDLSNNKLVALEGFGTLPKKAPSLKALNLGKNKFREINVLDKLHGMQIVELILEENPVCNNYAEKDKYISDVRKRFPKVAKLDGVDIPPAITFEVAEPVKMPEIKGSCFCNDDAKKVVMTFWEQFISLYDSNDRQPLKQAYHESATMSMMAAYSQQGHISQMDPSKKLSVYLSDSRNLLRNPDKNRKINMLHQGQQQIVTFLQRLPKTTHDTLSFVVDMPVAVENFILFNVAGLLKEREERNQPIRYFSRTFAIVPFNSGYVIVNEMYYITTATTEQIKGAFKAAPIPVATVVPAIISPAVQGPSTVTAPRVFTEDERKVLLESFSQQSGMNHEWSRKCLEENEWDFNRSAFVFSQLKEQGKIPPEAFNK